MEVVTSTTRGVGTSIGEFKYEEDTERLIIWNGTVWLSLEAKDLPFPPDNFLVTTNYPELLFSPIGVVATQLSEDLLFDPVAVNISISY
jgi:hypothetical protein